MTYNNAAFLEQVLEGFRLDVTRALARKNWESIHEALSDLRADLSDDEPGLGTWTYEDIQEHEQQRRGATG